MAHFPLLVLLAVTCGSPSLEGAVFSPDVGEDRSAYRCDTNQYDGDQWCLCQPGQKIARIQSQHDNHKEDRKWTLTCETIEPEFQPTYTSTWYQTTDKNAWDGHVEWNGSSDDSFLVGMESEHDNHKEDRKFRFKTARSDLWELSHCTSWYQINEYDDPMDMNIDDDEVIVGLKSDHSDKKEDREWYAKTCRLRQKCCVFPGSTLPVVLQKEEEFAITKNTTVGVLPYLGRSYSIAFQLFINTLDTEVRWNTILHFSIGGNMDEYGDRTPALWVKYGTQFYLCSSINGSTDTCSTIDFPIATNNWYNIEISQLFHDGEYMFSFKVDGVQLLNTMNNQPGNFNDVIMYLGDPWYAALDASVKELTVRTIMTDSPENWKQLATGLYYTEEKPMSWEEARNFCSDMGADMVVVESDEERMEITEMTADLIAEKRRFWIDVKMIDGSWKTHNGENTPAYTPWGNISIPQNGDCVRTGPDTMWYRADCGAKEYNGGYTFNPLCKEP